MEKPRNQGSRCVSCLLGAILLLPGCNRVPEGGTVSGVVHLDGEALAGASVRLWPKDDLTLDVYGGRTAADGSIELLLRDGQLVKPGRYIVLFAKPASTSQPGNRSSPADEQANILAGPGGFRNILPEIYSNQARSPFTIEVHKGSNTYPPFELKSKP